MKTKNLLLAIVALITLNLKLQTLNCTAQTSIPGGIVSGTWTLAGSPYNVQGSIQIADATTLTIQPGVTVNFQGMYKLDIQGRLLAIGTSTDTIIFTAANTTNGWRGIRFDNTPSTNDTTIIKYCKIQYGKATGSSPYDNGGAFYSNSFSKLLISNCNISYCVANNNGGAIYCASGSPIITNNIIYSNTAIDGGGIYCSSCNSSITNNTISSNTSSGGSIGGGGIYCDGNAIINNNTIFSNTTHGSGGGIKCDGGTPNIINNAIYSNVSFDNYGGGISCESGSPTISNNNIHNNSGGYGGGITCFGNINSPTISSNTIYNNSAIGGGGIACVNTTSLTINIMNNTISNNTATVSSGLIAGGGIACYNSDPSIINNTISNNTASNNRGGGGIYCGSSNPTIMSNTISNNSAINGGALYCDGNSTPTLRNCILFGNNSTVDGAQVFLFDEPSDPNFYYCDIQTGTSAFGLNGNFYSGTYLNNIDIDPLFVSPSGGSGTGFNGVIADWSLQSNSPCINSGDPNGIYPATDKAGNSRATVCRIDLGAYEYQNGIPLTATVLIQPILCNGGTAIAIVTPSGGSGVYTYVWSPGTGTSATENGLLPGTHTVTVTETGISCSITKTFTISEPALLSLTQFKTNASCFNNDGSASVAPTGGTAPYSYLWSNNSQNQSLSGIGSGTYSVAVADSNGCAVADTVIINNSIAQGSIPICMVTVDSTSTKNLIVWEKPGGAPIDSFRIYREIASIYVPVGSVAYSDLSEFTDNTNGINPNTTSYKYKLSVLDTCGNESPLSADHQTVHVQIGVAFPSGVNLIWNDYIGFSFSQYRILRDDLGNGNWQALDSVSFGITTYTSTDVLPNARYLVEATRAVPCVSTRQSVSRNSSQSNTASQTTGVDELANGMSVMIYPNPTNGKFKIELKSPQLKNNKCEIKIYNVLGVKVFQSSSLNGQTLNEIDLSASPKGIYFVQIYNGEKNYSEKIVVQ